MADLRFTRRVDALFAASSRDFLLREQFVTDPAQVLAEYVDGQRLPAETAEVVNHTLYAVLSNQYLLRWVIDYAQRHQGSPPSTDAFARDFSRAIAQSGDEQVILGVLKGARQNRDVFTEQSKLLMALISALGRRGGVFGGTEVSPGTGGTEVSPGTGGTEVSPGAVFRAGGQVFAGTEMSPGTGGTEVSPGTGATEQSPGARFGVGGRVFAGTEMSPGTGGTEVSPGTGATEQSPGARFGVGGQVFAGTEMSPGTGGTEVSPGTGATEQSPGARFGVGGQVFAGTEMSPGTGGTEVSPGTGATEQSPGARFGGIDIEVTFRSLVQFANDMRRSGALNAGGF